MTFKNKLGNRKETIYRFIFIFNVLLTFVNAKYRFFRDIRFKKQAVFLPMRLIRGLHLFYLGVLRPSRSLIAQNCSTLFFFL